VGHVIRVADRAGHQQKQRQEEPKKNVEHEGTAGGRNPDFCYRAHKESLIVSQRRSGEVENEFHFQYVRMVF
jgi:hypothetical protein